MTDTIVSRQPADLVAEDLYDRLTILVDYQISTILPGTLAKKNRRRKVVEGRAVCDAWAWVQTGRVSLVGREELEVRGEGHGRVRG